MNKPVCFVAMAFGRDDTAALYQNLILPVLRRNGITPVIINQQQSNDDLNIQIIDKLKTADFCIADLTYARPSVYFEAGFAQGSIPVIYTVRKDHLAKGQPEDLRVHFDLQMKPLIEWKSPADPTFAGRLERRLRATALHQWNLNNKRDTHRRQEIEKFAGMPLFARLVLLRRKAINAMRRVGIPLSSWRVVPPNADWRGFYRRKRIVNGYVNNIVGRALDQRHMLRVSVHAYDSLTAKELAQLAAYHRDVFSPLEYLEPSEWEDTSEVLSINLVLCLHPLSRRQIEKVLPHFTPEEGSKRYTSVSGMPFSRHQVKQTSAFQFLTDISSFLDVKSLLDDLLMDYIPKQTKRHFHLPRSSMQDW